MGELDHYRQVITTDLDGTFYCARAAGIQWRRQKKEQSTIDGRRLELPFREGSFIATASMSGHIVNLPQLQATYNAAKAGVIHLCKSLAMEWVGFARANTISPGYIVTEISAFADKDTKSAWLDKIPMGREGTVNELKGGFLYMASDASSYTTGYVNISRPFILTMGGKRGRCLSKPRLLIQDFAIRQCEGTPIIEAHCRVTLPLVSRFMRYGDSSSFVEPLPSSFGSARQLETLADIFQV